MHFQTTVASCVGILTSNVPDICWVGRHYLIVRQQELFSNVHLPDTRPTEHRTHRAPVLLLYPSSVAPCLVEEATRLHYRYHHHHQQQQQQQQQQLSVVRGARVPACSLCRSALCRFTLRASVCSVCIQCAVYGSRGGRASGVRACGGGGGYACVRACVCALSSCACFLFLPRACPHTSSPPSCPASWLGAPSRRTYHSSFAPQASPSRPPAVPHQSHGRAPSTHRPPSRPFCHVACSSSRIRRIAKATSAHLELQATTSRFCFCQAALSCCTACQSPPRATSSIRPGPWIIHPHTTARGLRLPQATC